MGKKIKKIHDGFEKLIFLFKIWLVPYVDIIKF